MNRPDPLTTTLRTLDPADPRAALTPRARADLEAILAAPPVAPPATPLPRRPTRVGVRVAVAAGAAAALTGALVLVPPSGGDAAFATWTAVPSPLTGAEQEAAAASCRERVGDGAAGSGDADALAGARTAVAERRGVWTAVVLAGEGGFSALCVTDASAGVFTDGMIGSVGVATGSPDVGPRDVRATDLGSGTMGHASLSLAAGHAGAQVTGVTYRSASHGDVAATVAEGRFALWLPGDELEGASRSGVDVEVTYDDGTTATRRLSL